MMSYNTHFYFPPRETAFRVQRKDAHWWVIMLISFYIKLKKNSKRFIWTQGPPLHMLVSAHFVVYSKVAMNYVWKKTLHFCRAATLNELHSIKDLEF